MSRVVGVRLSDPEYAQLRQLAGDNVSAWLRERVRGALAASGPTEDGPAPAHLAQARCDPASRRRLEEQVLAALQAARRREESRLLGLQQQARGLAQAIAAARALLGAVEGFRPAMVLGILLHLVLKRPEVRAALGPQAMYLLVGAAVLIARAPWEHRVPGPGDRESP